MLYTPPVQTLKRKRPMTQHHQVPPKISIYFQDPSLNGGKDTVSSASAVWNSASLDSTGLETAGRVDSFGKALDTKVAPIVEANNFLGLTCLESTFAQQKLSCTTTLDHLER